MHLLQFILRTCRWMMIVSAGAALLSGACNAALIGAINHALNHPGIPTAGIVIAFAALGLGKLISGYFSQIMLTSYAQRAAAQLRQDLVGKILTVPLRRLEQTGAARIMVALTDDVGNITQALLALPLLGVNLAILMGGAAYLGWLSWKVLLIVAIFIVAGALGYRLLMEGGFRYLHLARDIEDKLFTSFRGLTEGIKELKLHRNRRGIFLRDNIQETTEGFQRYNVAAENRFILAQTWSHFLFFVLLGVLLFLLPSMQDFDKAALTGYIITTLYLMGPLAGALSSLPLFGRAGVSLQRVENLGVSLAEHPAENWGARPVVNAPFHSLELRGVTHAYVHEREEHSFVLGPINLTFHPGETVFLVGGNGSGKSTLAKIITGLYPPEEGALYLNGKKVTDENRDDFRQMFSAVFADFYLFESFLGLESQNLDAQAREYLAELQLDHKVKVQEGRLSTTALSQGQRKRLALLTAYLEDRPLYLFDEWASDQDPYFKEIFYRELLPELKARGKTLIVITHDDKYYSMADRLIKLESGQVVLDTWQSGMSMGPEAVGNPGLATLEPKALQ